MQTTLIKPVGLALGTQKAQRVPKRQSLVLVRAESKPEGGEAPETPPAQKPAGGPMYIDELPEIKRTELSPEMKAKLRKEYLNLGGSPNTAMGQNWFLNISLFIAFLAVLSYLTGAL